MADGTSPQSAAGKGWAPGRTQPLALSPRSRAKAAGEVGAGPAGFLARTESWAVRWATPADSSYIASFIAELAEFEKLAHEVVLTPARLRADFELGRFEALLAQPVGGGAPVGFALFFHVYSTFEGLSLYLEDLYVSPSARGSGCGSLMLRSLAAIAEQRDCARLQWQALDWNEKARAALSLACDV